MSQEESAAWHQALVFALTGQRRPELGKQLAPDVDTVVSLVDTGTVGAYAVPPDLLAGIGPAQLAAVLNVLRKRLAERSARPVLSDRAPDADERRLLADVPPHHSG